MMEAITHLPAIIHRDHWKDLSAVEIYDTPIRNVTKKKKRVQCVAESNYNYVDRTLVDADKNVQPWQGSSGCLSPLNSNTSVMRKRR